MTKWNDETLGALSGAIAGVINAVAVAPLDVVKARMQIQKRLLAAAPNDVSKRKPKYTSTLGSLKIIFKEEGFRGYYRGFQPTVLGYAPTWAIYFTCYNRAREEFKTVFPRAHPMLGTMVSAVGSGFITNVISNPIWVIRARLQTQDHVGKKPDYDGLVDCAKKMWRREGVLSFCECRFNPNVLT